jgi:8-oxo-dGTP diphosphatase
MEAGDVPVRELMRDVRAVDWLPLVDAVERLSRGYERAFLENVGPIALSAAAYAASTRRRRAKPAAEKPRARRNATTPPPAVTVPASQPDLSVVQDDRAAVMIDAFEAEADGDAMQSAVTPPFALEVEPVAVDADATRTPAGRSLIQRMRDWLRRAV